MLPRKSPVNTPVAEPITFGTNHLLSHTQAQVARNYNVHITTFQRWLFDFRQSGSYEPRKRGHRQAVFSGDALKALEALVTNNPDATLEELRVRLNRYHS